MIPAGLFAGALWAALGGIAAGVLFLVVTLVLEWRRGQLW